MTSNIRDTGIPGLSTAATSLQTTVTDFAPSLELIILFLYSASTASVDGSPMFSISPVPQLIRMPAKSSGSGIGRGGTYEADAMEMSGSVTMRSAAALIEAMMERSGGRIGTAVQPL